jgi:hypothetical protein
MVGTDIDEEWGFTSAKLWSERLMKQTTNTLLSWIDNRLLGNALLDAAMKRYYPPRRRRHEEPRNRTEATGKRTFDQELHLPHLRKVGSLQPS